MHRITSVCKGYEEFLWQLDIFCLIVGEIKTGDVAGGGRIKFGGMNVGWGGVMKGRMKVSHVS